MPVHPEVQQSFAVGLVTGDVPAGVTARDPAEVAARFGVYRNNVGHSLTQALAVKFPVIQRLVGEAFFAQLARAFADTNRPQTPILMLWGDTFPAYLADFPPLSAYPYMADVARIEVARGVAYHAADCAPLAAAALSALAATGGNDVLRLHPAVQVIRSAHPAYTLWRSHQPDQTPGSLAGKGPECALIFRNTALEVKVRLISTGDAALIAALKSGQTLLRAAESAASEETAYDPSPLLGLLFQAGALIATNPE